LTAVEVGRTTIRAALEGTRALLLDMDGVLVARGRPIRGAGAAVARLVDAGIPFRVITNTSLSARATLARRLARAGIAVAAERIVTALSATVSQLGGAMPGAAVYVLGSADAPAEFAESGLRLLSHGEIDAGVRAGAVVIGDSEDQLTYENLNRAFRQVRTGATLWAMHRNPWWLTAAGPTLDSGALVVGLEYATGRRATVAGKPAPTIFRAAFEGLASDLRAPVGRPVAGGARLRRGQVAMVGDDLATDLAPARRLRMCTVLVLTGKHGRDEVPKAGGRRRTFVPDAVAPSIVEVVEALLDAAAAGSAPPGRAHPAE